MKTKPKYISRIDQPSKFSHGWYVRLRIEGRERRKFFSDGIYGSKRRAREEAENYRDIHLNLFR